MLVFSPNAKHLCYCKINKQIKPQAEYINKSCFARDSRFLADKNPYLEEFNINSGLKVFLQIKLKLKWNISIKENQKAWDIICESQKKKHTSE